MIRKATQTGPERILRVVVPERIDAHAFERVEIHHGTDSWRLLREDRINVVQVEALKISGMIERTNNRSLR